MSTEADSASEPETTLSAGSRWKAAVIHRPASLAARRLLDRRIQQSEYDDFLRRKIDAARISVSTNKSVNGEEVEAEFATRRNAVAHPMCE